MDWVNNEILARLGKEARKRPYDVVWTKNRGWTSVRCTVENVYSGEKMGVWPINSISIEVETEWSMYSYTYACGWQVADSLAISHTGRCSLKSFKPRCDSFLGRVLRDLGIKTEPLKSCHRSCCID